MLNAGPGKIDIVGWVDVQLWGNLCWVSFTNGNRFSLSKNKIGKRGTT